MNEVIIKEAHVTLQNTITWTKKSEMGHYKWHKACATPNYFFHKLKIMMEIFANVLLSFKSKNNIFL
jgi:hypothetical protein